MEKIQSSSIPVPAPRKCRRVLDKQECKTEQNAKRLLQSISYCALPDNIIWLDLFANERDLSFADEMIASNKLSIFNTAVDCIEFLDLSFQRRNLPLNKHTYSVITSGTYAIDEKVISQLLRYDFVNQIFLIVNEDYYRYISDVFTLDNKVNFIYNNDVDTVMRSLSKNYLNFGASIRHNTELYATKNDVHQENANSVLVVSSQLNINHNNTATRLTSKANAEYSRSSMSDRSAKKVSFGNTNCRGRPSSGLLSVKNKSPSMGLRSSSYQQMNLIESPSTFSLQYLDDVKALKELEQIEEVHHLFLPIFEAFESEKLKIWQYPT
jgi:hypothetical protein